MSKTIVVVGFGPGVSTAVAEKFGAEGFSVALLARGADRLAAGVRALKAKGITAASFTADASNPSSLRAAIAGARTTLGPIAAIHWNAFSGGEVGDLLTADPADVGGVFSVGVVGLLAAVQEVLPDLKAAGDGAVLVTNGAFGLDNAAMDGLAVSLKSVGVALANAAKQKLVGMLAEQLRGEGVYVGEVTIAGVVKGTAWAGAQGGIEGSAIAEKFWELHQSRDAVRATIS